MSWPLVKLGDVAVFINGDRGKNYPSKGSFVKEGVPFISAGNLSGEELNRSSFNYISEGRYNLLSKGKVKENDILFCLRGSLGKFAIVKGIERGAIASSLVIIRNNEKINLNFLRHYLGSPLCQREINQFENGAAQPNLSAKDLKSFKIPLPPLDKQKRIAAILDKADAIRRKRQQAIKLADDFLRSVFLDMFGDPITNPKGWEVKKLVDLCGVGSSKRVFVDDFFDSGIPFYRGTEVGKLGEGKSLEPSLFISKQHYSELKKHGGVPKIGDLLLPSICPDGRIWRVEHEHPFYFKDGRVLWIKSGDSDVNSDYLRSLLQRIFFANYSQIASGTTFAELKIIALKNLDILVPPMAKQIEFSNVMRKSMAKIETLNLAKEYAENNFKSLSQKAFAGEL